MPVTEIREINKHTFIGFWTISETIPELLAQLKSMRPAKDIPEYKSEMRLKEWLASRILAYQLLQKFTFAPIILLSNEHGKPLFPDYDLHVSISQSAELVGLIVSQGVEVGIDIEKIKGKALKVAYKFLSDKELAQIENNETRACLYWSAKETLYKMYSRKKLLFIENIKVGPIENEEKGVLEGRIITENFSRNYTVHYEKNNNFILTYCLA